MNRTWKKSQLLPTKEKHAGKREEDLKDLPHAEPVISTLTEEELLEQLGPGYRQLKDEVYQRLEFHPSSFEVKEYHICVYVSADGKSLQKRSALRQICSGTALQRHHFWPGS